MLITIRYPDEPPITYRSSRDRAFFEVLKYWSGLSIRQVHSILERPNGIEELDALCGKCATAELREAMARNLRRLLTGGNGDA